MPADEEEMLTTAAGLTAELQELLAGADILGEASQTYAEAGVLTRDCGLVVTLADSSQFHITVVRTRD